MSLLRLTSRKTSDVSICICFKGGDVTCRELSRGDFGGSIQENNARVTPQSQATADSGDFVGRNEAVNSRQRLAQQAAAAKKQQETADAGDFDGKVEAASSRQKLAQQAAAAKIQQATADAGDFVGKSEAAGSRQKLAQQAAAAKKQQATADAGDFVGKNEAASSRQKLAQQAAALKNSQAVSRTPSKPVVPGPASTPQALNPNISQGKKLETLKNLNLKPVGV